MIQQKNSAALLKYKQTTKKSIVFIESVYCPQAIIQLIILKSSNQNCETIWNKVSTYLVNKRIYRKNSKILNTCAHPP